MRLMRCVVHRLAYLRRATPSHSIMHKLVFAAGQVKCRSSLANPELAFCSCVGCMTLEEL